MEQRWDDVLRGATRCGLSKSCDELRYGRHGAWKKSV